jgi:hypothetical protein
MSLVEVGQNSGLGGHGLCVAYILMEWLSSFFRQNAPPILSVESLGCLQSEMSLSFP